MNTIRSIAIAALLVGACGCVVTKPVDKLASETEFKAWLVGQSLDGTRIRCELRRPMGVDGSNLWRDDTLQVRAGTNSLGYTVEEVAEVVQRESQSTTTRYGLGILPFGVDRRGRRNSILSQALISVEKTGRLTSLTLVYQGTNAFPSCPLFTMELKIR